MKIYYVDAENVGIDFLQEKNISVLDKVFVFTKNDKFILESEKQFYISVSGYDVGKNQADFHMIAHFSRFLAQVTNKEKGAIRFVFCSKDQDLLKAFKSQCEFSGISSFSVYPLDSDDSKSCIIKKVNKKINKKSHEDLILECLDKPTKSYDLQIKLRLDKPPFTRAINNLITSNKIKRETKNSKKWVRV